VGHARQGGRLEQQIVQLARQRERLRQTRAHRLELGREEMVHHELEGERGGRVRTRLGQLAERPLEQDAGLALVTARVVEPRDEGDGT
jgi:hypothetical protein